MDSVSQNLYWTDPERDRIEISRLDGSSRRVLISSGFDDPRAIAVDPIRGWIYWSDWGSKARIERAWGDGNHKEAIITTVEKKRQIRSKIHA